jgi:transposase-like protein
MRKSKFSESQIVAILKEGEAGLPVAEVCRKHGISAAIERDGVEGYLPTLTLPASQDVIVLEGAPEDSSLPAIARRWASDRAGDEVDFLLAYKLTRRRHQ